MSCAIPNQFLPYLHRTWSGRGFMDILETIHTPLLTEYVVGPGITLYWASDNTAVTEENIVVGEFDRWSRRFYPSQKFFEIFGGRPTP